MIKSQSKGRSTCADHDRMFVYYSFIMRFEHDIWTCCLPNYNMISLAKVLANARVLCIVYCVLRILVLTGHARMSWPASDHTIYAQLIYYYCTLLCAWSTTKSSHHVHLQSSHSSAHCFMFTLPWANACVVVFTLHSLTTNLAHETWILQVHCRNRRTNK